MELKISEINPVLIISDDIPRLVTVWAPNSTVVHNRFPSVDPIIYATFRKRFDVVEMMTSQEEANHFPKVFITHLTQHIKPDLSALKSERPVPSHFVGKNLSYDPRRMKGVYKYRRRYEQRFVDPVDSEQQISEEFFFPYADGFKPGRFSELANTIRPLYQLTSITEKLTFFKLMLLENGVFVSVQAKTAERKALPILF